VNKSEAFVFNVCRHSFLSLWSYGNPQRDDADKELCDVLVVCEPDIIIFSVKDIGVTDSGELSVDWDRWCKRAIEASARQIYGAERHLESASNVTKSDGTAGLPLPPPDQRRIHRVAVALGGMGKAPIMFGNFGKGFVHVFDERSFGIILRELDTISDFVGYLVEKENLFEAGVQVTMAGEEDLLAVYLHGGRKLPHRDVILLHDDLWAEFMEKPEYKAKVTANKDSYAWDKLIEFVAREMLSGNLEFGPSLTESEIGVRTMAREDRFSRRILGKQFQDFLMLSRQQAFARLCPADSGVIYLFLAYPRSADRELRVAELGNRCFVARGLYEESNTVVGIATEQYDSEGFSLDVMYLHIEEWTREHQQAATATQEEFAYFVNSEERRLIEDEYPAL